MRLIDVDKLEKAIDDFFEEICVYDVSPNEAVEDFQNIVNDIETIEFRPRGEWQEAPYVKNAIVPYYWYLRCSECGYEIYDDVNYNYCPHCGADMRSDGYE